MNLPEELWPELLARLPVKTLLRFRSVSKQWRELIDDPSFARLHLRLFSKNSSGAHLLVHRVEQPSRRRRDVMEVRCIHSFKLDSMLHIPQAVTDNLPPRADWGIFSAIDGILMLRRGEGLMLWNPATRKTLTLPPSPEISEQGSSEDFGLGFDPSDKDYKHVRLVRTNKGAIHSIAVYSLATNSWKMIGNHLPSLQRIYHTDLLDLSLKGFLFRLALTGDSIYPYKELISFDFRTKTLASKRLPVHDDDDGDVIFPRLTMADDGCSLAVVFCSKGSGSVWVLEGLGARDFKACTWAKRYAFSSKIRDFHPQAAIGQFLYLTKNGELLIHWDSMVTSCNLKTNEEKVLDKMKLGGHLALAYTESLLAIPN